MQGTLWVSTRLVENGILYDFVSLHAAALDQQQTFKLNQTLN